MKKLLVLGLVSLSLAQAKFFVGVDGGWELGKISASGQVMQNGIYGRWGDNSNGWNANLTFGYEKMFGNHFGLRALLKVGYAQAWNTQTSMITFNNNSVTLVEKFKIDDLYAGINIDALLNFINTGSFSFGFFVGAGADYAYTNQKKNSLGTFDDGTTETNFVDTYYGSIPIYGRAGFTVGLGESQRIDLTVQAPIVGFRVHGVVGEAYSRARVQLGYKFLF